MLNVEQAKDALDKAVKDLQDASDREGVPVRYVFGDSDYGGFTYVPDSLNLLTFDQVLEAIEYEKFSSYELSTVSRLIKEYNEKTKNSKYAKFKFNLTKGTLDESEYDDTGRWYSSSERC